MTFFKLGSDIHYLIFLPQLLLLFRLCAKFLFYHHYFFINLVVVVVVVLILFFSQLANAACVRHLQYGAEDSAPLKTCQQECIKAGAKRAQPPYKSFILISL